jgi:hypothetical protein
MQTLESERDHFRDQARKWERRAEEVSTDTLREYYRGRAAEARAAASSLSKFIFDPEQDTYQLDE